MASLVKIRIIFFPPAGCKEAARSGIWVRAPPLGHPDSIFNRISFTLSQRQAEDQLHPWALLLSPCSHPLTTEEQQHASMHLQPTTVQERGSHPVPLLLTSISNPRSHGSAVRPLICGVTLLGLIISELPSTRLIWNHGLSVTGCWAHSKNLQLLHFSFL